MERDYKRRGAIFLRRLFSALLEAVFPRYCVVCRKEGSYICHDCALFLSDSRPVCPSCGRDSRCGMVHKRCKGLGLNGLVALWDYEGIAKRAIGKVRDDGVFHLTEEMIEYFIIMLERDSRRFIPFLDILLDQDALVTFVPLGPRRKKMRGFDQAEVLAGYLAGISGKRKSKLLKRVKETAPQSGLEKKERFLNVKGAFSFVGPKVNRVVLVDDIWTSGATMTECCRILRENGVKEIWGFVLARD